VLLTSDAFSSLLRRVGSLARGDLIMLCSLAILLLIQVLAVAQGTVAVLALAFAVVYAAALWRIYRTGWRPWRRVSLGR